MSRDGIAGKANFFVVKAYHLRLQRASRWRAPTSSAVCARPSRRAPIKINKSAFTPTVAAIKDKYYEKYRATGNGDGAAAGPSSE